MKSMYIVRAYCEACNKRNPFGVLYANLGVTSEHAILDAYCFACGRLSCFTVERDVYLKGDEAVQQQFAKEAA